MISSEYIQAVCSWEEIGPCAVSSVIVVHLLNEQNHNNEHTEAEPQQSLVRLRPKVEDEILTITLNCEQESHMTSFEVTSNAKHMEVYNNRQEYLATVKGQTIEGDQYADTVLYRKTYHSDMPHSSCILKFLSLTNKKCFILNGITTTLEKIDLADSMVQQTSKQIDMVKVREMLASMSSPIPDKVQHLMQTVEQYQENQSSVWNDIKQRAECTSAASMTGMMSLLANTMQHKQIPTSIPSNNENDSSCTGKMSLLSSTNTTQQTHIQTTSSPSNNETDAMSKLMASICGNVANTDTLPSDELYKSLKSICQNVSKMRLENKDNYVSKNQDILPEKEASGCVKETYLNGNGDFMGVREENMIMHLEALEERMMGRLERRLDALETHLELRLNRIESVVENLAQNFKNDNSKDNENEFKEKDVCREEIKEEIDKENQRQIIPS